MFAWFTGSFQLQKGSNYAQKFLGLLCFDIDWSGFRPQEDVKNVDAIERGICRSRNDKKEQRQSDEPASAGERESYRRSDLFSKVVF